MGFASLIPIAISLLASYFGGRGSGDTPQLTEQQKNLQAQIVDLIAGQNRDYQRGEPLRRHIQDTADWLLPKQNRVPRIGTSSPDGDGNTYHPGLPGGDHRPGDQPPPTTTPPPETPPPDPPPGPFSVPGSPRISASGAPPSSLSGDGMQYLAQYLKQFGVGA